MADSHEFLAALDTLMDVNSKVMELSKRTFSPPRLNLLKCHIIYTGIIMFELLVISNE